MDPLHTPGASTSEGAAGSFAHQLNKVVKTEPVSPPPPVSEEPGWPEALNSVIKVEPAPSPPTGEPLLTPLVAVPLTVAGALPQQHQPQRALVRSSHSGCLVAPTSSRSGHSTGALHQAERGRNVPPPTVAAGGSSAASSSKPMPAWLVSSGATTSLPSTSRCAGQSSRVDETAEEPAASAPRSTIWSALISPQGNVTCGVLVLSDEEKRLLKAGGHGIPQRLPLSSEEEQALRIARKKIRNRISAQESRKRKKEYLNSLEEKLNVLTSQNEAYQKKLAALEEKCRALENDSQEGKPKKLRVSTQHASVQTDVQIKEEIMDQ